ncbi:MAG: hypothetical protein ABI934_07950, partial [Actinomycetota bacterium]
MTRIYVPLNAMMLRVLDRDHSLSELPILAYAVTEAVRAAARGAGQDEWEYTALSDAVRASAVLLTSEESRRIVAAADVSDEAVGPPVPTSAIDESAVTVSEPVALNRIASFHVDGD